MEQLVIEVKKLEASPLNARRTVSQSASEELKASILAHGLMQNLVVTEAVSGSYHVIAGARRLAALSELQAEGKLPADYAVPCQLTDGEQVLEMSLAENTVRLAMHPADEFDAFARLVDAGETIDAIAGRFGVSTRHVEQRLKLAKVAPELLGEYRDGKLTLDCLMAFTVSDDHAKQLQVYESLLPWQAADGSEIRALLTEQMVEATSKLARFVGLDAYKMAGGSTRTDLFGEEIYLEDPELLHDLAGKKLHAERQALLAAGWGWVQVGIDRDWSIVHGCSRIYKQPVGVPQALLDERDSVAAELQEIEQALEESDSDELLHAFEDAESRLQAVEEQLARFVAYDHEQMRLAGCYVTIDQDGTLRVDDGLVRREDAKQLQPDEGRERKAKGGMPDSLRRALEAYRQQAAQVEIARHRLIALDLLVFTAACQLFDHRSPGGLELRFGKATPAVKEQTPAGDAWQAIEERLPLSWLQEETQAEQFQAFISLSDSDKLDLLAYCAASTLQPRLSTGREDSAYELALSLTDARMESYFRPTGSNFLSRITRDQLLALGRDLLGDAWSQARSRDKKGQIAEALERAFADAAGVARHPEQIERLKRWLPDGMAFGAVGTDACQTTFSQAA